MRTGPAGDRLPDAFARLAGSWDRQRIRSGRMRCAVLLALWSLALCRCAGVEGAPGDPHRRVFPLSFGVYTNRVRLSVNPLPRTVTGSRSATVLPPPVTVLPNADAKVARVLPGSGSGACETPTGCDGWRKKNR